MKVTIVKLNKTKSWFFEKINKIDKPLAKLIRKKSTKLEMKKRLQQTMQKYKGLSTIIMNNYRANKMDSLEEMDRFLRKFSRGRNRNYEQPNYKH